MTLTVFLPADMNSADRLTLTVGDLSAPLTYSLSPGLTSLHLDPSAPWTVGIAASAELTGTVVHGVTDAGTVTFPLHGDDIWLAPDPGSSCVADTGEMVLTCNAQRISGGTVDFGTVLATAVLPGSLSTIATLPGSGGSLPVAADEEALRPSASDGPIQLTGPFGGVMVGAPMMRCQQPVQAKDRSDCTMKMLNGQTRGTSPITRVIDIPDGATLLTATLTWAATSALPGRSLDNLMLHVNGVGHDVTGTPPAHGPNTPQVLVTRTAEVTPLLSGPTVAVSATDLPASLTSAGIYPAMAAWSLTVVWSTSTGVQSIVQVNNSGNQSDSSLSGTTTVLAEPGNRIDRIQVTLWAVDDWADKSVHFESESGDESAAIPGPMDGNCRGDPSSHACGFQIWDPEQYALNQGAPDPLADSAGQSVVMINRTARGRNDTLWIGPTLVIRDAT